MPERKDRKFVVLDAVVDEVPNAVKLNAPRSGEPCASDLDADTWLLKEDFEPGLEVFTERTRS